jgi:exodeoxyribonuclease VII large subunit
VSAVAYPGTTPETALSIAALNNATKDVLEGAFEPLWVKGEVSKLTAHSNGHWYFTLKDARAQLSCVVWSRDIPRIPAKPDDGMSVTAFGQLSMYPARGQVQFMVTKMEAEGEGLWRKAFEATRASLEKDGLLDPSRKRALPRYPRRVAMVTSLDGAALHDVRSVLARRDPTVELIAVGATVQGESAPASIVAALDRLVRWHDADPANYVDTVIVGRGGGSREDLWCFNDERVARAIAACPIPTISAVGHEVDVTIADLVADLRAATPSAAAEAAVPVLDEVRADVAALGANMRDAVTAIMRDATSSVRQLSRVLALRAERSVERRRARVQELAARVDGLSPLSTLARGYAVARQRNGGALPSATGFRPGMEFDLQFRDGIITARTEAIALRDTAASTGTSV